MKLLNLGCGSKFVVASEWTNADMSTSNENVMECNFLNGIPFPDATFEGVYHSHVLEHFSKKDGLPFLKECFRILASNGILRIALPDLEVIAREYLNNLERALKNEPNADEDYEWIMLEMYDQTVRNSSGGDMLGYFQKDSIGNVDYIAKRIGAIAYDWEKMMKPSDQVSNKKKSIIQIIKETGRKVKEKTIFLTKEQRKYIEIGKFRLGGEIHQWMYDRYSLSKILKSIGFNDIIVRSATESYIENWAAYQLDNPHEHASLFIEAKKR